jgi:hypothetical protein
VRIRQVRAAEAASADKYILQGVRLPGFMAERSADEGADAQYQMSEREMVKEKKHVSFRRWFVF